MPYRTFNSWLFDGSRDSKFPEPRYADDGKEINTHEQKRQS